MIQKEYAVDDSRDESRWYRCFPAAFYAPRGSPSTAHHGFLLPSGFLACLPLGRRAQGWMLWSSIGSQFGHGFTMVYHSGLKEYVLRSAVGQWSGVQCRGHTEKSHTPFNSEIHQLDTCGYVRLCGYALLILGQLIFWMLIFCCLKLEPDPEILVKLYIDRLECWRHKYSKQHRGVGRRQVCSFHLRGQRLPKGEDHFRLGKARWQHVDHRFKLFYLDLTSIFSARWGFPLCFVLFVASRISQNLWDLVSVWNLYFNLLDSHRMM